MDVSSPLLFLGASLELAAVDLLLGADNAVLIALASRILRPAMRPRALVYAVGGAIVLRFALAAAAGFLMKIPFVKLVGAAMLMAIAIELLAHAHALKRGRVETKESDDGRIYDDRLWRAVATIIGADAVMSLDNVLALASIAQGNLPLLALGVALGIPALALGSFFVARILDRLPVLVVGGAALLGWVAGQMAVADVVLAAPVARQTPALTIVVPALCAIFVALWGRFGPTRKIVARRILIGAAAVIVAAGGVLLIVESMLR